MQVKRAMTALALSAVAISSFPALAATSCPALRWTTLGTAGGPVPTAERSEPANLLTIGERRILVDTGDGTVDQLARIGLDLGARRHGVHQPQPSRSHRRPRRSDGLRWMNQFAGVLTVYGPVGTRAAVEGIVASMATPGSIGFGLGTPPPRPADSVRVIELADGQSLDLGAGAGVKVAANSHFDHDGKPDPDNASLSYRFVLGTRSITYTGDTGPSAAVTALAKGSDMFVSEVIALDALLGEIRARRKDASPEMLAGMERHLSTHHLRPEAVGEIAAQAGVGRVVLTHFAVPPGPLPQFEPAIRAGIAARYHGAVDLARDLQSFDLGCRP